MRIEEKSSRWRRHRGTAQSRKSRPSECTCLVRALPELLISRDALPRGPRGPRGGGQRCLGRSRPSRRIDGQTHQPFVSRSWDALGIGGWTSKPVEPGLSLQSRGPSSRWGASGGNLRHSAPVFFPFASPRSPSSRPPAPPAANAPPGTGPRATGLQALRNLVNSRRVLAEGSGRGSLTPALSLGGRTRAGGGRRVLLSFRFARPALTRHATRLAFHRASLALQSPRLAPAAGPPPEHGQGAVRRPVSSLSLFRGYHIIIQCRPWTRRGGPIVMPSACLVRSQGWLLGPWAWVAALQRLLAIPVAHQCLHPWCRVRAVSSPGSLANPCLALCALVLGLGLKPWGLHRGERGQSKGSTQLVTGSTRSPPAAHTSCRRPLALAHSARPPPPSGWRQVAESTPRPGRYLRTGRLAPAAPPSSPRPPRPPSFAHTLVLIPSA